MFKFFIKLSVILVILSGCSTVNKSESYKLRSYEEKKLANGMTIFYIEDHSLPYFSLSMLVVSGSVNDPVTKAGLGYTVTKLLDKGSKKRTAIELADSLGQIGASFGASIDDDYLAIRASSLSLHRDILINDFIEMVTEPAFKKAEIERLKKQTVSQIRKTVDDPSAFASVVYSSYLYGAHPYGRRTVGTIRDINSIKRKDIQAHYDKHFSPNNVFLAVIGDFDNSDKSKIERLFSGWKRKSLQSPEFPIFPIIEGINVKLVDKSDLKQSQIRIGHKAIKRSNSDFLPLRLASIILGGAFSSRLMKRVRIEKGLTYSIGARFGAQKDFGSFTVSTFTRHEKVGETITETLNVLQNFKKKGISKKELSSAKALAKGLFPRALETAERFAENLMRLRIYGIKDDYLKNYYKNINSITLSDVNNAIARHLHPQNIKILVFAPKGKTLDQLRPIGLLEVEDYKQFIH